MAEGGDNPNIKQEPESNSNTETGKMPTRQKTQPYVLNKDKALKKKEDAEDREKHVDFKLDSGQLVIKLTATAYTTMSQAIETYYKNSQFRVSAAEKVDQKKIITERLLCINNPENEKEKLRVSMYHTTSKMLINGSLLREFLAHHLNHICQSLPDSHEMVPDLDNEIKFNLTKFLTDLETQRTKCMPLKKEALSETPDAALDEMSKKFQNILK